MTRSLPRAQSDVWEICVNTHPITVLKALLQNKLLFFMPLMTIIYSLQLS